MQFAAAVTLLCFVAAASALQCFTCNSKQHPECNSHYERHLKACQPLSFGKFANKEAIGCRKIEQDINGEISIVRECAYTGEKFDGKKISGTSGVTLYLYQCSGDRCNAAPALSTSLAVAILATVALLWRF
ncbi:hypothetical protein QR680_009334 [Steinernema hermaphroditum]|uniref:Protein sleepless n=1 Tax=Steinernema hermaphroditum TaxID=289476 RepID=A0AA39IM01_9BILA|nr:hypothetical protein QR680_009334 [Steinernema hermaphroditum]